MRYRNRRYWPQANGVGPGRRAMAQVMPNSVETFHIVPQSEGMAVSRVTLRRSDLEVMEYDVEATSAMAGWSAIPTRRR